MAKQNWTELDLADVSNGMSTNRYVPGNKYAKELLNLNNNIKPGKLTLRPGYKLKNYAPADDNIPTPQSITFELFFDKVADPNGKEIICLIQKGTLKALTDAGDYPVVPDTLRGFQFWCRPYWDGSSWIDNWDFLNKTIITKINSIDTTYKSHFKIFGNSTHGLGNDSLIGWTIFNKTKNQYAKIITCKLDVSELSINITLYNNSWEVNDVLIISKNWIDIAVQEELYDNVGREDIVFHKINNDLRIGFGGYENRPGLVVGYRKRYLTLKEIDFTNMHSDLLEAGALEKFTKTDRIILDTIILNDQYGIELSTVAGTMEAKTYNFRLSGLMDGYEEQFIGQANITVDGTKNILLTPYINLSKDNLRLTAIKLYYSPDNIEFNLLTQIQIISTSFEGTNFTLTESGQLKIIPNFVLNGQNEYHQDSNCTSINNEVNSLGQWYRPGYSTNLNVESSYDFGAGNITAQNGTYYLRASYSGIGINKLQFQIPIPSMEGKLLNVSFYAITNHPENTKIRVSGQVFNYMDFNITSQSSWQLINFQMVMASEFVIEVLDVFKDIQIGIDSLSITDPNDLLDSVGNEMSNEMGYDPTFDLVKGWDDALIYNGRTYYLNPYIDKRWDNFIYVSLIHPNNTFLWDIATSENFREIEKNDANIIIGMELLPNNEILLLKNSSITALKDNGNEGIVREPIYGVDCIAKNSIVNIEGNIFWCGKEDIYVLNISNSMIPKPLLKDTIRDLYLAIAEKQKIFAVRDRFNNYRIRLNLPTDKTEYLLTDNGWVKEKKYHFTEVYRINKDNKLYFLSSGVIYEINDDKSTDAGNKIPIKFISSEVSVYENAQSNIRFLLGYISGELTDYINEENLYIKIHFKRGVLMAWESIEFIIDDNNKVFRQKLPAGLLAATFYIELYGNIKPLTSDPNQKLAFELTALKMDIKNIPIGKFGGDILKLQTSP